MHLSIKALHYFLVACEQQSMVRAAELLHVVPSAISSAVDSVEQMFELKLIHRYPAKGIKLTAAGFTLMQKIRHLIEEYDNLLLEGAELRTALSGRLSIGYYAPVAPAFMPAIVGPLVAENSDVRLEFTECDNERAQTGLLNGEFDCIVFVAGDVRGGIEYEALLDAPPYLLVPEHHPLTEKTAVSLPELNDQPLILLDLPFTSEYYRSLLDEQGVETKIVATASTTEMVRSLVGAGVGVSILNMCPATALSYAGDKVCVLPITSAVRPLRLVLGHQGGNRRRLLQVFIEACREYFASESASKLVVSNKPFTAEPVNTNDLAEAFRAELPDIQCLDQSCDLAVYEQGARGESGRTVFVMQPQTTQDVSRCVAWCIAHDVSFIPQSGNTGLVGASVPDNSGTQVVLSLRKVRSVFALDTVNRSVTVSAGLRLSELNNRLEKDQLFLPVDLSADPMIGGMIATNTGGSRFLRYGDMRRQVLGLTVVLPDKYGTVLHLGSTARKNNIGLDEKQRYIGTSGQFGVITEAVLSLEYAPQQQAVALVIPKDDQAVVTLLGFLELHLGSLLSAYELMSGNAMRHALHHASSLKNPFAGAEIPDVALLVELTRSGAETDWDTPLQEVLEHILEQAWELHGDSIQDALFGRAEAFWSLRHAISEGVKAAGKLFAFDLGFARQQALAFRSAMMVELPRHFPELEICDFGHIGDGGLHFNLVCHQQQLAAQPDYEQKLRDWVMEQAVTRFGASFSAEHGIGPKNQRYLGRYGNQQFGCLPT